VSPPCNVVDLRTWRRECCGGMRRGRWEVTTAGFDPNLQLIGADPYSTPTFTGLVVPTAPTTSPQKRYLFQLARVQFNAPEKAYLVGLRLYASLFGFLGRGEGSPGILRELEITSPMWRFPDANISWHVMLLNKAWRARRNPLNADSLIFRDAYGPALLFETLAPYTPPNAGRPWGRPIASDLANIHDLRYPWRDSQVEVELRVPLPSRVDLGVFCSVAQHDPSITLTLSDAQAAASTPEDRFWAAYQGVQYGRVAASVIVEEDYGTP